MAAAQNEGHEELGVPSAEEASDELLLGAMDMVSEEDAAQPQEESASYDWRGDREPEAEPEPVRPAAREGGGTLFERMSSIARGAAKAQVDDEAASPRLRRDRDPLDIPRFLNRQNNQ
jgi:cell division protein FtsZ